MCTSDPIHVQGNCTSDPIPVNLGLSGPSDLVSRTFQQCVLVTDVRFLRTEQSLWLDNLYIRFKTTIRTRLCSLVDCFGSACKLWLTSVTLQGDKFGYMEDNEGGISSVAVVGGQLWAKGASYTFLCSPVKL
jgi:hypothetical protein